MAKEQLGEPTLVMASRQREIKVSLRPRSGLVPIPTNVFALQLTPEGAVLSAAFAVAPLFTGTPLEQKNQLDSLEVIEAEPSVQLLIPFRHLPLLIRMLSETNAHIAAQPVEVVQAVQPSHPVQE